MEDKEKDEVQFATLKRCLDDDWEQLESQKRKYVECEEKVRESEKKWKDAAEQRAQSDLDYILQNNQQSRDLARVCAFICAILTYYKWEFDTEDATTKYVSIINTHRTNVYFTISPTGEIYTRMGTGSIGNLFNITLERLKEIFEE